MAGTIVDFFGYRAEDNSETALSAVARNLCPFIHDTCNKTLGRDGTCSGVCAVRQVFKQSANYLLPYPAVCG